MNFTVKIGAVGNDICDPKILGAKGFALHKMAKNGFPVPGGFIVTSLALDNFMAFNDLSRFEQVLPGNFPKDLGAEIESRIKIAGFERAAVRSSSDAEDSASRSFAGQFDSFLAVAGADIPEAIKKCWRSLANPRAFAYSSSPARLARMAVIVQEMIGAQVSGVAFSLDPVTGDKDKTIIEAVLGGNEPLVQGLVTPDRYEVGKDLQISDKKIVFQKETLVVSDREKGLKKVDIDATGQKLGDREIVSVAALVGRLRDFFKTDVDVEWAIGNGKLYVLQCRPVTV